MKFLSICILVFLSIGTFAQSRISGTVYDASRSQPLEAVSVLTTSGKGTLTDSMGRYNIIVQETDSIYFSYLNKPTGKFPVKAIPNIFQFDISLHVPVADLPVVKVKLPNYRMDSLQNRRDYARIFNYEKPGIGIASGQGGAGVGLDLDQFINMFHFRYNRRMEAFQKRLIREEQDKSIDHRFTHAIVKKITGLSGDSLDVFMKTYRPSYQFTQISNDYEFLEYIKLASIEYKKSQKVHPPTGQEIF